MPPSTDRPFNARLARKFAWLLGIAGLVFAMLPMVSGVEQDVGLRWLFALRGARAAPRDVVLLAINSQTTDALNLPEKPAQWSRELHTRAVNRLREAGAGVIVFDLFFEESRAEDTELADAMRRAGNVVLTKKLVAESEAQQSATKQLQLAAAANSPFVLPRETVRVDGFWAYKSSAGDVPMLPVSALQVFASSSHDLLRRTLTGLEPALGADLGGARGSATDFDAKTASIRKVLRNNPALLKSTIANIDANHALNSRDKFLARALLRAYAADEAQFLNFFGAPHSIRSIPYHRIVNPNGMDIDAAQFKNKAVFIGFAPAAWRDYEAIRDDYHTVFSRADGLRLSGVEIAATAFANLLDGSQIQPLNLPLRMLLFALWGALAGLLAGRLSMPLSAAALGALGLAYLAWATLQFARHNIWLPLVVPLLVLLPAAFLGATLVKYLRAKQQQQRAIDLAKQFVPEDVLHRSLADAGPVSPNMRIAYGVCLATDVKNYTQISESLAPQALANLMNEYVALVNATIEAGGGKIADLRGDAVLALWADNQGEVELRRRACLTALALHNALEIFNRTPSRVKLETRIGLHAGEVALGTLGAAGGHLEFRAVGDIVNTASRVEGLNKILNTTLLATVQAAASVGEVYARPLGKFQLAGKSQPLEIVQLMSRDEAEARSAQLVEFAAALAQFHAGNIADAATSFAHLSRSWPDDGAVEFYTQTCQARLQTVDAHASDPIIHIDSK